MNENGYNFDFEKTIEIIMAFGSEKDYFELLKVILLKMMDITSADAGTLYISEGNELHFNIMRTVSMDVFLCDEKQINLPPIVLDGQNISNISAYAAIKNEIVTVDDVYDDGRFNFDGPKTYDKMTGYRTKSMLVLPLTVVKNDETEVIGVIQLINSIDKKNGEIKAFGDVFNPPVLPSLANIAANTLSNILYAHELKVLFNSFIGVMTKAIDERSPYNTNHTRSVSKYCELFAVFLSKKYGREHPYYFNENRREQLVIAAYLHDIGKIITPLSVMDKPDRLGNQIELVRLKFEIKRQQIENEYLKKMIDKPQYDKEIGELDTALLLIEETNAAGFLQNDTLDKIRLLGGLTYIDKNGETTSILTASNMESLLVQKGTLTEAERKIMQEHVGVTGRLLNEMTFNRRYENVPLWARSHHEFSDGTGYPQGISGDEVTIEISILTITDIFDALIASDRPYKKAMPVERALDILSEMAAGGKLNADMVSNFIESRVWVE